MFSSFPTRYIVLLPRLLFSSLAIGLVYSQSVYADTVSHQPNIAVTASNDVNIYVAHALSAPKQLQLHYSSSVRVNQILADTIVNIEQIPTDKIAVNASLYWPASALYTQKNADEIEQLQYSVLKQLDLIKQTNSNEAERKALDNLALWIESLPAKKKLLSGLDYDAVRVNSNMNPLINQNMLLVLPTRPKHVTVVGAVVGEFFSNTNDTRIWSIQPWTSRYSARDYLANIRVFDDSENSFSWVIQPDGNIEKHPIAYWNFKHMDLAAGALIYMPFTSLPKGAKSLNEDMLALLRNSAL
ncbi:capsule biosynthesis GfcC family protein [Photobacterium minamisatsumaniensis]|uniref:capsule biosynthesis GfcC family protein n=1 Tax=Photobacterium minamisatsumaniensis TaxID=2910233 RepID=UPI003D0EB8E5